MSTDLATRPAVEPTDTSDDNTIHVACGFDSNWALCGKDVTNDAWYDEATSDLHDPEDECPTCAEFDEDDFCAHCSMGEA